VSGADRSSLAARPVPLTANQLTASQLNVNPLNVNQ
jgi:hypothetical protein